MFEVPAQPQSLIPSRGACHNSVHFSTSRLVYHSFTKRQLWQWTVRMSPHRLCEAMFTYECMTSDYQTQVADGSARILHTFTLDNASETVSQFEGCKSLGMFRTLICGSLILFGSSASKRALLRSASCTVAVWELETVRASH